MPRKRQKRHKPEEVVTKLRQVDVLLSQGQGMADAIRQIGVSEVACGTNCSTARSSTRYGKLGSYRERPPACLSRLQITSTGGHRACIIRVASCATPTGSAGHAGVTASSQLTFHLGHSKQTGQLRGL
jgi:hypothetical protein